MILALSAACVERGSAAEELRLHIKKITGADLPLAMDEEPVTGARIRVGESKATQALGLKSADFAPQEYLIRFLPSSAWCAPATRR